ncbi:MAG: carbohydrate ABC transporter permease [Promethearchaeota archaeon]
MEIEQDIEYEFDLNQKSLKMEKKSLGEKLADFMFILPAYLALILFVFFPIGFAFIVSLFENPSGSELRFAFRYYLDTSNYTFTIINAIVLVLVIVALVIVLVKSNKLINKFNISPKLRTLLIVIFIFLGIFLLFLTNFLYFVLTSNYLFPPINAENLSLISIFNFFFKKEYVSGFLVDKGVFIIEGIPVLLTIIFMIWYTRIAYRRLPTTRWLDNKIIRAAISFLIGLIIAPIVIFIFEVIVKGVAFLGTLGLPINEYKEILTAPDINFLRILFNTFFWTLFCTILHIILGLALAIVLNRKFSGRGFFRSIFILPWAIPSFVSTLMWRAYVFDSKKGILGSLTGQFGSSGSFSVSNLFGLILAFILAILVVIYSYRLVNKRIKISPTFRPLSYLVFGIIGIFLIFFLNDLIQILFSQFRDGFMGYKIVDIPKIEPTFWITGRIDIFGLQFTMITFSAIMVNVWLGVPFMMLSFLATLQTIPQELYEAAEIDGLSSWQQFRKVTLPLLKPTFLTVSLLGIIWTFNLFNVVYLLSQNQTGIGPGKYYQIFVTFIYERFSDNEYSQAAALSFTVFIILISFSLVYSRLIKTEELWESEE